VAYGFTHKERPQKGDILPPSRSAPASDQIHLPYRYPLIHRYLRKGHDTRPTYRPTLNCCAGNIFYHIQLRKSACPTVILQSYSMSNIHRVSKKKTVQTYFLSELCQIYTDCENFWHKDSRVNTLFCGVLIFHLT